MCKVMEDMRNEAAREAVNEKLAAIIFNMVKNGDSIEKIAALLEIDIEEVKALIDTKMPK